MYSYVQLCTVYVQFMTTPVVKGVMPKKFLELADLIHQLLKPDSI